MDIDADKPDPRHIAQVVRLYEASAKRLRERVLNPPGASDSAREWNQARAAQILAQVETEITRLKGEATKWTGAALSDAMTRGLKTADAQARQAGITAPPPPETPPPPNSSNGSALQGSFALVDHDTVRLLAQDTVGDLHKAADSMRTQARNVLHRMAATGVTNGQVNAILAGGVIEGKPTRAIRELREALRKVHGKKVTIKDKNGDDMTFGVGYYAKMVAVTKTREASCKARHARLASRGMDLVVVIGRISVNFCTAYMDKVFSLSGTSKTYPPLDSLPGDGPPFHPNCSKSTAPFIEALADPAEIEAAKPDHDLDVMLNSNDRTQLQKIFQATQGATQAKARAATLRTDAGRKIHTSVHDDPKYQTHLIQQMGVQQVELHGDARIGAQLVRGLQQVLAGGGTMPRRVEVAELDKPDTPGETTSQLTMRLNPAWPGWRDDGATMRRWYEDEFTSSADALHPIYHESAHVHAFAIGYDHGGKPFDLRSDRLTAGIVSDYAMESVDEFMAEFRAGRTAGKRYPKSVMELYERLGGR